MKVLILSATTGGGHMRAANALKDYITEHHQDAVVEIYDTIHYVSPIINKAVTNGYVYLATKTPAFFGSLYKNSDKNTPINKTVELTTSTLRKRLLPMIEEFMPDIVITTHSFACEMICGLKVSEGLQFPVISIITDFAVHKTYIHEGVDAYILSSEEMVEQMLERGIERRKLFPYGIPVKKEFLVQMDAKELLMEEGLDPDLPTMLIMAGSFGVTDVLKVYHKIVKSPADFQVIVITGKNEKLYETFEKYLARIDINNTMCEIREAHPELHKHSSTRSSKHRKPAKPTKLLFFTDRVERYMRMADIIVTKPGGLTVTEAIACGLPLAIFKAIPGQEEQNADFLLRNGMAVRLEKDNTCTQTVTDLITDPEKLQNMRRCVLRNNKGNSCERIYELMLRLLSETPAASSSPASPAEDTEPAP